MIKLALGSLFAAIAVFMWGFFFWGSGIIDPFTHMTPDAETAITDSLKNNLTTDGVYFLPESKGRSSDDWMQRTNTGPIATINFRTGGMAPMGVTMGLGFLHMLVCAVLLGLLLRMLLPVAPGYMDRLKLVVFVGALAAVSGHLGSPIWWHYPWNYAMLFAIYDFGTYVIGGAVLAGFIAPAK
jgi:hypothetical protein